jgi:hypothetical protein
VDLVGPEGEGFWLEGDEYFLSVVVFREFGKSLWAVLVERDNRYVSNGVVGGLSGCLACFVDACKHEVICEFGVEVPEVRGPVGEHGVEVESPEFILSISRCRFLEEWGKVEWVAEALRVEGKKVA